MSRLIAFTIALTWASPLTADPVIALAPGDDLARAVANASPGSVLELAGGDYGALTLKRVGGTEGAPVTLRSTDPENPARLSRLDLREAASLVFDGFMFDYEPDPEDPPNLRPFQVSTTRGLTIRNSVFDGGIADSGGADHNGFPTGFGLSVRASADILLENNEIRDFYRGLVITQVVDLTVRGNDLHSIRMDGMNFAQVERVLIEENILRDFKRAVTSDDHADMIQFWTRGTGQPSRDIVIRRNILNSGLGWYTQSIFMRNEEVDTGRAKDAMFYRNVIISENIIINAHLHGITVGETEGLTIRQNTLANNSRSDGDTNNLALWRPQIRVAPASRNVSIIGNIAHDFPDVADRKDWLIEGNLAVQNHETGLENHFDQIFVAATTGDPRDLASFRYLSDGPASSGAFGAPKLLGKGITMNPRNPSSAMDASAPAIRAIPDPRGTTSFIFQVNLPSDLETVAQGARFSWDLGDGVQANGARIEHSFALPGQYSIMLETSFANGQSFYSTSLVTVRSPEVLRFEQGDLAITSFVSATPSQVEIPGGGGRIPLGRTNPAVVVPNVLIAPVFGSEGFELALRIRTDKGYKAAGEILRIHQFLIVSVGARGSFDVRFTTQTSNEIRFTTGPTSIFAGNWLDIVLRYSNKQRSFEVIVNGELIGKATTSGPLPLMDHWGLALGNPFDKQKSFEGEAEYLQLRVGYHDGITAP